MVGCLTDILEPDAAFLLNLTQEWTAVCRKDERQLVFTPRSPRHFIAFCCYVVPTVPLSLWDVARNILDVSFGLSSRERCKPRKQHVVCWPARGRPLGNRLINASFWSCSE